jgi:hypothetical protein
MKKQGNWMLLTVAGLLVACHAARAQEFVSPGAGYGSSLKTTRDSSPSPSWLWVNSGVATQVAGSFADWATSWKQPEGNQLLAQPDGPYAGRFYRTGTVNKVAFSAGLAALSYVVAWKWPHSRKYVGVFNMAVGAGFGAAAISNVVRNPYYKP